MKAVGTKTTQVKSLSQEKVVCKETDFNHRLFTHVVRVQITREQTMRPKAT